MEQRRYSEIDALKGILISLIILGHNYYFGDLYPLWFSALYNFHVACFLLLPFVFSYDGLDLRGLGDRLLRTVVPQFSFLALTVPLFFLMFVPKGVADIQEWAGNLGVALIVQNEQVLEAVSGFRHFWFLPAMVTLLLLLYLYDRVGSPRMRAVMILVAVAWHALLGFLPLEVTQYIPWGLPIVGFLFAPGLVVRYLYRRIQWNGALDAAVVGAWLVALWWCFEQRWFMGIAGDLYRVKSIADPGRLLFHDLFLILSFFAVFRLGALFSGGVLPALGRQSLRLFLIVPLLWQVYWMGAGERLAGTMQDWGFELVAVSWMLMLLVGWLVCVAVERSPLNPLIFPRSLEDWRGASRRVKAVFLPG